LNTKHKTAKIVTKALITLQQCQKYT